MHRGQKPFQVPIMAYINSIAYVQQKIDTILFAVYALTLAYIDDIVCRATSVADFF